MSEMQAESFEIQQQYYSECIAKHPNWVLVRIYADEGISATSVKNRKEFNQMIEDCQAGKIDMIITKSVSRFARTLLWDEQVAALYAAIAQLTPIQQRRIHMLMENMTIREIARQEGCHMNAALKSVNGALKKLHDLLKDWA